MKNGRAIFITACTTLICGFFLGIWLGHFIWYTSPQYALTQFLQVARIVDGDTVRVIIRGREEPVRLMGINTPETVHPTKQEQCGGKNASLFMSAHSGKKLRFEFLEAEFGGLKVDQNGRLLAYMYAENGEMLNLALIQKGLAREYTHDGKYPHRDAFKTAQANAQKNRLGIWASDECALESGPLKK